MINTHIPYPVKYIETQDIKEIRHLRSVCDEMCSRMFRVSCENQMLRYILANPAKTRSEILNGFQTEFYKSNNKLLPRSYFEDIIASINI